MSDPAATTKAIATPYPVYCALDTTDLDGAVALARVLKPVVAGFKLGLEFFGAHGPSGVHRIAALGSPIFLDLKLHDIPNTVGSAIRSLARMEVAYVTVHASGGKAMLRAAAEAALDATVGNATRLQVLGVTVLTSLDQTDLEDIGVPETPDVVVLRLARLAIQAGLDGIVCAPHEVGAVRRRFGDKPVLMVPGVRAAGDAGGDDQKRTMTPETALASGASFLVVGRPITRALDPVAACHALFAPEAALGAA